MASVYELSPAAREKEKRTAFAVRFNAVLLVSFPLLSDTGGPDGATANDGSNVDFTWTDNWDLFKTGRPGFRIYSDGAKFDNVEVCPNP